MADDGLGLGSEVVHLFEEMHQREILSVRSQELLETQTIGILQYLVEDENGEREEDESEDTREDVGRRARRMGSRAHKWRMVRRKRRRRP